MLFKIPTRDAEIAEGEPFGFLGPFLFEVYLKYFLFFLFLTFSLFSKDIVKPNKIIENNIDLNFDGIKEKIVIEFIGKGKFVLKINNSKIERYGGSDELIKFVDIDKSDNNIEIAIAAPSPNTSYTYFFNFRNDSIICIGELDGRVEGKGYYSNISIDGSGIVRAKRRGRVLQTWFYNEYYKLSNEHKLVSVERNSYLMNTKVTILSELILYKYKNSIEKLLSLKPNEEVTIISSDNKKWLLFETKDKIRGWIEIGKYKNFGGTGKIPREVLKGLSFAG